MANEIIVLDLETTIRCPVGTHKANPMWIGNKVIAAGYMTLNPDDYTMSYSPDGVDTSNIRDKLNNAALVVGHNIKFDLLYIYRNTTDKLPNIWDTQLAEYLLEGQREMYPSLDELTEKYRGTDETKDERIKEYWKRGVDTDEIPPSELLPYLEKDVQNTAFIFKEQVKGAELLDIQALMSVQMDALRATIEMNRNGMAVDWDYLHKQCDAYGKDIKQNLTAISSIAPDLDASSPKQLSLYYFGGVEKVRERVPTTPKKDGTPRTKWGEVEYTREGKYPPFNEVGKGGYYSTDDSVLRKLIDRGDELASHILSLRKNSKIKETYYEGLNKLRFPSNVIYPNLNHTGTKTGRLSSNNPNLQNQTDEGDVKRAYVSRYGKDGVILELDYSQLEMVALAYIANDQQLIDDINNGRDMHRELYKEMYGRYPTDKERKPFKRFSFLLVYGGGATTLMAQSGCDKPTAQRFIRTFYNRYRGVKEYHERITKTAEAEKSVVYDPKTSGPRHYYTNISPTGRRYIFHTYYNEYKKDYTFSPTELKNWPIQGFATGDIVPMAVGSLLRALERANLSSKALLVMTVHDSVVLDIPKYLLYTVASIAKNVLESAPKQLKTFFNIDFPCKLSVGVEYGSNWQDKKELKL